MTVSQERGDVRHRVLIVDDDPMFREVAGGILSATGYDLVEAVDGVDGLDKVTACLPDVVLLDLMLPVLDGYQVFQALKVHPTAHRTPVIFVTASTETELSRLAQETDAFACLHKPVRPAALLATIELALLQAGRQGAGGSYHAN